MIYELIHPDFKTSSYLLGTMHAQCASAFTYYPKARNLLSKVQLFAAEINMADPELQRISEIFRLPKGIKLQDLLSVNKYQKIRRQLIKSFRIDLDNLASYQPIFIINQLVPSILKIDYPLPLDVQLYEDSKQLGLEIGGLESINDQYNIVNKLVIDDQLKQLKQLASNPTAFRHKTKNLSKMYARNEPRKIFRVSKQSLGKFKNVLLKDRNFKMVDSFHSLAEDGAILAAVGASHLHGKYGFIRLLKAKGYKIKQV